MPITIIFKIYAWSIDPTVVHVALPLACFIILEVQLNKELHAVIKKGYLWAFS